MDMNSVLNSIIKETDRVLGLASEFVSSSYTAASDKMSSIRRDFPDFLRSKPLEGLRDRAINQLNAFDKTIDDTLPSFEFQDDLDAFGTVIDGFFDPLVEAVNYLNESPELDNVYANVLVYLAKIAPRCICTQLELVHQIVKTILYTAVHPAKSLNNLAKELVTLIHLLAQPETWSQLGAGVIGFELGKNYILAHPASHLVLMIGIALIMAGVSAGALKEAIIEETKSYEKAQGNFSKQAYNIVDALLLSAFTGIMVGAVQKAMSPKFEPGKNGSENKHPQDSNGSSHRRVPKHAANPDHTHRHCDRPRHHNGNEMHTMPVKDPNAPTTQPVRHRHGHHHRNEMHILPINDPNAPTTQPVRHPHRHHHHHGHHHHIPSETTTQPQSI